MKVKDLISELTKLDQNLEVFCYSEDKAAIKKDQLFFTIDNVSATDAEIKRNKDELPIIKFGHGSKVVVIEMLADD